MIYQYKSRIQIHSDIYNKNLTLTRHFHLKGKEFEFMP